MNLTAEQIQQAVQSALPDVLAGLREQIKEQALYAARDTVLNEVRNAVSTWVKENLVPEIQATLVESKDGLVAIAPQMAASLNQVLCDAFVDSVKKKMESSWDRRKVFEALLGA